MILLNEHLKLDQFFLDLSKQSAPLLILDYDGTLAPLCSNPLEAFPYPGIMECLKKILHAEWTRVVILSGRALQDLKGMLGLRSPPELWGSYGGERLPVGAIAPTVKTVDSAIKELLVQAAREAKELAPELYCEIKPFSIALHWRGRDLKMAQEESSQVLERWKTIAFGPLEIRGFDGGMELRVQDINKGEAVTTLLQEIPTDTLIAYLGDDLADEEAFEKLGNRALKILVRTEIRPTKADMQLVPPHELLWFLDRWIQSQKEVGDAGKDRR